MPSPPSSRFASAILDASPSGTVGPLQRFPLWVAFLMEFYHGNRKLRNTTRKHVSFKVTLLRYFIQSMILSALTLQNPRAAAPTPVPLINRAYKLNRGLQLFWTLSPLPLRSLSFPVRHKSQPEDTDTWFIFTTDYLSLTSLYTSKILQCVLFLPYFSQNNYFES